jgi:hypothetical protein
MAYSVWFWGAIERPTIASLQTFSFCFKTFFVGFLIKSPGIYSLGFFCAEILAGPVIGVP